MNTSLAGCNLRVALAEARRLDCTINHRRGTGELHIRHPHRAGEVIRISGHRKDAPRSLTSYLQQLARLLG